MMKAFVVYVFALLFLPMLSCRDKEDGTNQANNVKSNTTTQVKLIFWHGIESPESINYLKAKLETFHENHPDIIVEDFQYGASDQVGSKIMIAVAGNNAPDLMWWGPNSTGKMARTGKLVKAQNLIDEDSNFNEDDIYEALWEASSYNGEIWTVPFDANNVALYYNRAYFQEAGIVPEDIKTWEDLRDAAKKLTRRDRYGFMVSIGKGEWTTFSTLLPFLWQAGGEFLSFDNKTVTFNSPAGQRALQFLSNLVNKDKSAKLSEPGAGYKIDDFLAGRVAMMICGSWNYNALKSQERVGYGAIFLPKDKKYATAIGGENLYIFKSKPEKEKAAWEFAKFIMSPEFQVDWAITTGYLPVSKKAANNPKYKKFLAENPFIKTFVDQMQYGKARPAIPSYQKISDEFNRAAEKVFHGKIPSEKALKKAAQKANQHLTPYTRSESSPGNWCRFLNCF